MRRDYKIAAVGGEELKGKMGFKKIDQELFLKIANHIKEHPNKYRQAGKWLDKYYEDAEFLVKKQKEIKQQKRRLITEIKKLESDIEARASTEDCGDLTSARLEGKLFTKNQRLELISQFETKRKPPLKERLAYALEDLFSNYTDGGVLSESNAKAALLITWVATNPETNEAKLNLTKFANVLWKTEHAVSDENRFGLAPFLFFELDIALHYQYQFKPSPDNGYEYGPVYELNLNYLPMIHRAWRNLEAEKEWQAQTETEQETKSEKYYIKLAEQFASNLEDWANPKTETGLRYEYVGHLKPIRIALEGFDELLDWLHLNKPEEGKVVQAEYDKLVSQAKLDDHLLETLYEGDEVLSEQCAIDLADTLRAVAKITEGIFVEEPGTEQENKAVRETSEEIPPERKSVPLSLTRMAQYWGGDMTAKKVKSMIKTGTLKTIEINRQTYIFDTQFLPAHVIEKVKK